MFDILEGSRVGFFDLPFFQIKGHSQSFIEFQGEDLKSLIHSWKIGRSFSHSMDMT